MKSVTEKHYWEYFGNYKQQKHTRNWRLKLHDIINDVFETCAEWEDGEKWNETNMHLDDSSYSMIGIHIPITPWS